jgi:hypothetical protein
MNASFIVAIITMWVTLPGWIINPSSIDFVEALGREPVFEGESSLNEDEVNLWLFWVENDFLPGNSELAFLASFSEEVLTTFTNLKNQHNKLREKLL